MLGLMSTVQLTLITKPECHLCDDAREVVAAVRQKLASVGIATELEELNILEDPKLARLYAEEIPVVQINGRRHAIWRVNAEKFEHAIVRAAKKPKFLTRSSS